MNQADSKITNDRRPIKHEKIIPGSRYGMLIVKEAAESQIGPNGSKRRRWKCVCDCGRGSIVLDAALKSGHTSSCGCAQKETVRRSNTVHLKSRTPEYSSWRAMMHRCYSRSNVGFKDYMARGISVCPAWHDVRNFIRDMGPRPSGTSLDRINNDGNYEPGNCRWATPSEQQRNRRANTFLTINGERKCVAEWADISGNTQTRIIARLKAGWREYDAVFQRPLKRTDKKRSFNK